MKRQEFSVYTSFIWEKGPSSTSSPVNNGNENRVKIFREKNPDNLRMKTWTLPGPIQFSFLPPCLHFVLCLLSLTRQFYRKLVVSIIQDNDPREKKLFCVHYVMLLCLRQQATLLRVKQCDCQLINCKDLPRTPHSHGQQGTFIN